MACTALIHKMDAISDLRADDVVRLRQLCLNVTRTTRFCDIISQGDRPLAVHLIIDGWAARYTILPDGQRQITAFLMPGDFCDLHIPILREMDHGIMALTKCAYACVDLDSLQDLTTDNPGLAVALSRLTLIDEAILRQWIVNVGRRDAGQAIAHLFCELKARADMAGISHGPSMPLPLTQEVLADATGITPVHANRTIQALRHQGMIRLESGRLTILDRDRLQQLGGFDASYLHLKAAPIKAAMGRAGITASDASRVASQS
ncbi:Crp/Fnr family transcriptional regulator [Sphingomonas sanguinis]|uniref:Crp/Fnr family transcriptional regulator n=1 Tax=Sphingomonas sanguinis TaxID=33051 RepID=A0ABU5LNM9_9SPHN|nr:Crp/Fnr family transcriptional regulator [Sphingomonas sanguinis]MDZ7281320.1 Crp/Fnr family transcriptional regulator [Sphingomonas sanguinis]